ncbi:MAG TPA: hypothetical protein VF185_02170 [Patescibacteria group bacterium]
MNLSSRKRIIMFLAAFTFFVAVMGFLFIRGRQNVSPANPPAPPQISTYVNQTFPIKVQLTKDDFNFPTSLPLLYKGGSSPITLAEAKEIALKFGFTGEVQELKDIQEGIVYSWSNETAGLSIRPNRKEIKYTVNQALSTSIRKLSEPELIEKAATFLEQKNLLGNDQAKTAFVYYFSTQASGTDELKLTTIDKADYVEVNFSVKASDYKLLTLDPLSSPIGVRLLPDGNITEVDLAKLPEITKGGDLFKIKNYDQFVSTIKEAKIVSLNEGEMLSTDPNANPINSVNVTEVELVYLIDSSSSNYYQPVFLIKGTADIEGIGKYISSYMYLPAITK